MAKNKANKRVTKHSILEAQRAQSAISRESYIAPNSSGVVLDIPHFKSSGFALPIPSIKKDLAKDFIFAALSIALLVYLKESRWGFAQLNSLFGK